MKYPKCTLTDREIFDICPPAMKCPFITVEPFLFEKLREMVSRCVARMVDNGELLLPGEKHYAIQPMQPVGKTPIYIEDLITILHSHDALAVAGYSGTCERVVHHDRLREKLTLLLRDRTAPAVEVASPAQGTAGQWQQTTKGD